MYKIIEKVFFSLLFCISIFANAQYTEIINSNKPGFSQSPFSVGSGIYQFESSFFYSKSSFDNFINNKKYIGKKNSIGLNLDFRTSFLFEKLEFNLNSSIQQDKITSKNIFDNSYKRFGLGKFNIGAKYLIFKPKYTDKGKEIRSWKKRHSFDMKRWIPNIGIYYGINFGGFLNPIYKHGGVSHKVGILLLNEFSKKYNFITNVYYNYIGSEYPEWSYIITATYNFNDTWAGFIENQAKFSSLEKSNNFGAGLAFLFSNNLQFNTSVRSTLINKNMSLYANIGASYRIDRHKDKFIELDDYGNKIEGEKIETYNKSFFGRLFDKISNIFKKKKTVENSDRKPNKSILDDLIKNDKKSKKNKIKDDKRKKIKKEKALRKAKREKEKREKRKRNTKRKREKRKKKEKYKEKKRKEKKEREIQREKEKREKVKSKK